MFYKIAFGNFVCDVILWMDYQELKKLLITIQSNWWKRSKVFLSELHFTPSQQCPCFVYLLL